MRRRDAIFALVASAFSSPLTAWAQLMRRVVLFTIHDEASPAGRAILDALRGALRELGWRRKERTSSSNQYGRARIRLAFPALASDLARQAPDVIVSVSSAVLRVLHRAVPNVPIVFIAVSNPDGQGFVCSLNRPGGSITGFVHLEYSIGPKWVQLLTEIAPDVKRVLVIFNPDAIPAHEWLPPIQGAYAVLRHRHHNRARSRPLRIGESHSRSSGADPGGGLLRMPEAFTALHRHTIIEAALRSKLPAIYPWDY